MRVGRVVEIWRYPVKSMGGERIERAPVRDFYGLAGDRGWAIRDEKSGDIRGAKKLQPLLLCAARYLEEPAHEGAAPVEIELPDGACVQSGAEDVDARLSQLLERSVTLQARRPKEDLEHYRRHEGIGGEAEVRTQLGLLPDEPLPDMSGWPRDVAEFVSPPGTYFDTFELHLLTHTSLETLARHTPGVAVDVRRFRPNLVIDCPDAEGLPEIRWCGRQLEIGGARLEVQLPMVRCVMTTCAQPGLARAPEIMRSLVRETRQDLGVGARVILPGEIRVGDAVALV